MYVEFLVDIPSTQWTARSIHDLPDTLASVFIKENQARESSEVKAALASVHKQQEDFQRTLLETISKTARPTSTQGPPTGGGGVDFDKISHVSSPEDRGQDGQKRKGSFGELCKCVFMHQAIDTPPELRAWATNKLRNFYGAEKCDYEIDERTGEIVQTITRTMDYGTEVITRSGTESVSGGATYGFAIKPEWYGSLFQIPIEQQAFVSGAFNVPIGTSLEFKWPALDQYKGPTTVGGITQSAVYGGFSMSYVGEQTARVSSDAALDMINFKIVDLTGYTALSRDLIADNYIAMDAMAQQVFARGFQWMEDYMAIQGGGVGKPQGYFNANATLSGGGGSGNSSRTSANLITYEDLTWMVSRLHSACWQKARFITNTTTIPQLMAIKNSAGTYVYQPNALIAQSQTPAIIGQSSVDWGSLVTRPAGLLLGFPVYVSEKVPALGTKGDLSLVDPSQYGYAKRQGLEIGLSEHFLFSTDQIAYRFKLRHDGKSLWRAPYIQADGSSTKVSPFILVN